VRFEAKDDPAEDFSIGNGKGQVTRPKTYKIYYDDCGVDDDICDLNVCVILYG